MPIPALFRWLAITPLLLVGLSSRLHAAESENTPPNIIFILTDDQRDNTFGAMGHPVIQTPHLDALMAESTRFRNAYAPTPVCAPSRISYLTGMPERLHGVGFSSSYVLTAEQWEQTYPAVLRRNGYYTGFVGKFGVEYYTFQGKADQKFDYWWGHDGWTKFLPKDHDEASTRPYHRAQADTIPAIMAEAMTEFLDSTPSDQPFCLSVSLNVPHGSQATSMFTGYEGWHSMTRPANENPQLQGTPFYDELYRHTDLSLPADALTDPYRFIPEFIQDQDAGRRNNTYAYDYHAASLREHHIRYFQIITGLDQTVGKLRAELKNRGLDRNTIIIYGSDHGLLMGEYGMGGKGLLLDLSAKIPSLIHDPRLPAHQRGQQTEALVSGLDYARTILDYAGVAAPDRMEGRSLRPLVENPSTVWRDSLFLESLFTLRDTPFQEGIRTDRWKYIRMYDGVINFKESDHDFRGRAPEFEMLFDLHTDPTEHHNLAQDPAHATTLAQFRAQTAAESEAINARRTAFMKTSPPAPRESKSR